MFILLPAILLLAACAKSESESDNDATKRYVEAWMYVHYPDIEATDPGYYLLEETEGTGMEYSGEYYVWLEYNTTDLAGNYSGTTYKTIAQQIGEYEQATYYGPQWMINAESSMPAGLSYLLEGMKIGGSKKAVIPGYLNTYSRYDTAEEYLSHESSYSTSIYEITLRDFTDDIVMWEVDSLERHMEKYYEGLDSTAYGIYYYQTLEPTDTTSFDEDTTIFIDYIARRLDGQVYETTIEDTAKYYGVYDEDITYEPIGVSFGDEWSDLDYDDEDDEDYFNLLSGMKYVLYNNMRTYEQGTVMFISYYGFYYSGNDETVPIYCPLQVDIMLVDDPDD